MVVDYQNSTKVSVTKKHQIANIWIVNIGFVGHMVSVTITQFCHCSMRAAFDKTNGRGCIPIKLYLQNQEEGQTWPMGHT